ncbi:MAG: septal ring lytic transglycosylase RlpA family protein [Alphaproteobacteria bacterium]|nr:septal ring lytic transglycosylase RlpA family protein [Alphaproteobacteria bacterium]
MLRPSFSNLLVLAALCCLSVSCATRPVTKGSASSSGYYKVGTPYKVKDIWYYPNEDYSYDETGIASWYGDAFHNKKTANGEIFNKNELTAAHKTLPLPCLARVTNLENGRSIVVRVNDRGPFSGKRIIDLSQRSAELLGFENKGLAKVRVQVLADESKAIADAMRRYGKPIKLASAEPPSEEIVSSLASAPVERETLKPVHSTRETRLQLMKTRPVQKVVQLPVTARTRLFVQAGAFSVPENAYRLKEKLDVLASTTISTVLVNGTKFYRVRLGPLKTIAEADALLTEVQDAGVPEARTVVD